MIRVVLLLCSLLLFSAHDLWGQEKQEPKTQKQLDYESFVENRARPSAVLHLFLKDVAQTTEVLELTSEQTRDLRSICLKFKIRLIEIAGQIPGVETLDFDKLNSSEEFANLEKSVMSQIRVQEIKLNKEVAEVLLPPQLKQFGLGNFQSGLPVILVQSFVGDMIELTADQKSKIKKQALKVADEFEQGMTKYQNGTKDRIRNQMTAEQWQDLEAIIGEKVLADYPSGWDPEFLIYSFRQVSEISNQQINEDVKSQTNINSNIFSSSIQPALLLHFTLKHKDRAAELLELMPDQVAELEAIGEQYRPRLVSIAGEIEGAEDLNFQKVCNSDEYLPLGTEKVNQIRSLQAEVNTKVSEVLMEPQIKQFGLANMALGLPVILVHSAVGDFIGLTERQKKAIEKEALKVADEFEAMVAENRKEMREGIRRELTREQWDELEEIYGKERLANCPQPIRPKWQIWEWRQVAAGDY